MPSASESTVRAPARNTDAGPPPSVSDDAEAGRRAARAAMDDLPLEDRFTRAFADAAVAELGRLIDELPAKIKDSVAGGRDAAEALSTDPLQGLAEVVQNADDQFAGTVTITWDTGDAEVPALLIAHDGTRLHLADLVAMVLPWVSNKRGDDRSTGRFGIGLNTLRTIGDGLHIHCEVVPGLVELEVVVPRLSPASR